MKVLKFKSDLVGLIMSGQKYSTWRIFDDKNLSVDDVLELKEFGQEKTFAKAKITDVNEKLFGDLTSEDKLGHEKFRDDEDMYRIYSDYYHSEVGPNTKLKIIRFKLIN